VGGEWLASASRKRADVQAGISMNGVNRWKPESLERREGPARGKRPGRVFSRLTVEEFFFERLQTRLWQRERNSAQPIEALVRRRAELGRRYEGRIGG